MAFSECSFAQTARSGRSTGNSRNTRQTSVPKGNSPHQGVSPSSSSMGTSSSHSNSSVRYNGTNAGKVSNNPKVYRPGITHSMALAEAENEKKKSAQEAARKAAEAKKAEEAKKQADASEFKSINRLISPPKPKTKKPSGPFVSQ